MHSNRNFNYIQKKKERERSAEEGGGGEEKRYKGGDGRQEEYEDKLPRFSRDALLADSFMICGFLWANSDLICADYIISIWPELRTNYCDLNFVTMKASGLYIY